MSENLFVATESNENERSTRILPGSAELTTQAFAIASDIMQNINDNVDEFGEDFEASKSDSNAMDRIISNSPMYARADVAWLKEHTDETLAGMLKSNQSKRSRLKTKVMTVNNYKSLLTAAISEMLVRKATNTPKSVRSASSGTCDFSPEAIEKLAADQDDLRREIRNQQSKISIAKKRAGDDFETDERFIALKAGLEQLMSVRVAAERANSSWRKELKRVQNDIIIAMTADGLKKDELTALALQLNALREMPNIEEFTEWAGQHPEYDVVIETEDNTEEVTEA